MSLASSLPEGGRSSTLDRRIEIEEQDELVIDNFPKDIAEQLEKAAFKSGDSKNTYIKTQESVLGSNSISVVEVTLEEDQLVISVADAVGVIDLTPTSKLQINPKIGWNHILQMFLAVQEHTRTLDYHGIPIREFLADDLGIEDIFVIVAVNYLNSLEPLFRHGLVRELDTKRVDAFQASGRIDVERSLKNTQFSNSIPKQHFIQREINYNVPVNSLVYRAGIELLRLFQLYSNDYLDSGYFQIFSRLEDALRRLENYGIANSNITPQEAAETSVYNLHPQRHYYQNAIRVSKTILSSTIGKPLDEGREELTMDYIISMDNLFEKYSQSVIENKIKDLQNSPYHHDLEDVTVKKKSFDLFADTNQYRIVPDHVIYRDDEPIAIIDSKYYAMNHSPLKENWGRSRLLGYGYRLGVDELAFLCPLGHREIHSFEGRDGNLQVIAPEEFSTDLFEDCIDSYLRELLNVPLIDTLITELEKRAICRQNVDYTTIDDLIQSDSLKPESFLRDSVSILRYLIKLSDQIYRIDDIDFQPSLHRMEQYFEDCAEGCDYIVPLFIPAGKEIPEPTGGQLKDDEDSFPGYSKKDKEHERIQIHCLNVNEQGDLKEWNIMVPLVLNWHN